MHRTADELGKTIRKQLIEYYTPLYAFCAYSLEHIDAPDIKTLSTDGTRMWINVDYFNSLDESRQVFVYAHEVSHDALQHPYRCAGKDPCTWNEACDHVVNLLLYEQKIGTMPDGCLYDLRFKDMSAEQVYAILAHEKDESKDGESSSDSSDPSEDSIPGEDGEIGPKELCKDSPTGSFHAAPGPGKSEDGDKTPEDWEITLEKAYAIAEADKGTDNSRGGDAAPGMKRAIDASKESRTDWIEKLRIFAEKVIPSHTSWMNLNRRLLAIDILSPGVCKDNLPKLGMGIDTSGSVSQSYLEAVAFQISVINRSLRPREIEVVYSNSAIQGVERFGPDDDIVLHAKGGGGTHGMDFWPVIDHFNAIEEDEDKPKGVLIFTDLHGKVPPEPDYPVLWIVPMHSTAKDPAYGETIRISI